jgi:sugar phosphate permease
MINESYLEVSPVLATVMNIIILLSGVGGSFFAKLIYPRFLRNESVIIILFFIAALPLVCLMLTIGNVSYWVIIALMAVIVFLMSGASVFTSSYIAARFSRWGKDATVAGILNSGAALGIVAANMGFTAIADATDWNITILVWILVMVVSILLIGIFIPMWTKFLKKSKNNI